MSSVSKFYKLTSQMLMEYIPADQFDISKPKDTGSRKETDQNKPAKYYLYEGKDANKEVSRKSTKKRFFQITPKKSQDIGLLYPQKIFREKLLDHKNEISNVLEKKQKY